MYIYNDEDNAPMDERNWDQDGHNPTVYSSYAEMKAIENDNVPFSDLVDPCCANCIHYDGDVCMKDWNNGDEAYYVPGRDDKAPCDYCEDWEED